MTILTLAGNFLSNMASSVIDMDVYSEKAMLIGKVSDIIIDLADAHVNIHGVLNKEFHTIIKEYRQIYTKPQNIHPYQ